MEAPETDVVAHLVSELPVEPKQQKNKKHAWKPGESGNPNGRPKKGYSITEMMQEMLANEPDKKRALGEAILAKAMSGDVAAQKAIWNYMDGMPTQGLELTGKDGGSVEHNITVTFE